MLNLLIIPPKPNRESRGASHLESRPLDMHLFPHLFPPSHDQTHSYTTPGWSSDAGERRARKFNPPARPCESCQVNRDKQCELLSKRFKPATSLSRSLTHSINSHTFNRPQITLTSLLQTSRLHVSDSPCTKLQPRAH